MTAEIGGGGGDFVAFLIGMRINKPWKVHKWFPVAMAMPRMQRGLAAHPEAGCLGSISGLGTIIQYWRSFDHLEAYARSHDRQHWPAWVAFNKKVSHATGDVGIWHETFLVPAGRYETFYGSMPPTGRGRRGEPGSFRRATDGKRREDGSKGKTRARGKAKPLSLDAVPTRKPGPSGPRYRSGWTTPGPGCPRRAKSCASWPRSAPPCQPPVA